MPDNRSRGCCMICGRPSQTVVCMRCYFNYDYRTYNNRELEKPASSRPSLNLQAHDDSNYQEQEWQNEVESADGYDSLEDHFPEFKDDDREQTQGWFSRLHRFF